MEHAFWQGKWNRREIGFHQSEAHPYLIRFLPQFDLHRGARILVPLCGKSLDMCWMLAEGYKVVGVELVETAVIEFFEEIGVTPNITKDGDHTRYAAEAIDIWVGDIFTLTPQQIGPVDFIYDRAALVALPKEMTAEYASQLIILSGGAPQMLIGFEYDQAKMEGPPFALSDAEIQSYYGQSYETTELARMPIDGGLKGQVAAIENVRALRVR